MSLQEIQKQLDELKAKAEKGDCPHCGACPHCGRKAAPAYPYPVYPQYPYWRVYPNTYPWYGTDGPWGGAIRLTGTTTTSNWQGSISNALGA